MTNYDQFRTGAKTRHDYADMIQVRYSHPNGENFDTWVSGEEVMARLNTRERERLIKSFSRKNWRDTKAALRREAKKGKEKAKRSLKDRLADTVSEQIGDNIIGDTLADNVRGADSQQDPREREKAMWLARLQDEAFRAVVLQLAWIKLEGTLPDEENTAAADDWV